MLCMKSGKHWLNDITQGTNGSAKKGKIIARLICRAAYPMIYVKKEKNRPNNASCTVCFSYLCD